ncbi:MAG TPA: hydrogen peroxide-dependent heme synthase [Bryobacteraceae bacterium]|nr:hydrogen peroxide-dependent heme synthase [Bryobacteraceae bacterium]
MNAQNETLNRTNVEVPPAPLTLEGYSVLHQMYRVRWDAWKALPADARLVVAAEAAPALEALENGAAGQSALFSLIGHKGDLMLIHFRDSFAELKQAELSVQQLRLGQFLEPASSFLSMVELGLYDSSVKLFRELAGRGVEPHSEEWNRETAAVVERQKQAMHPRLYPKMPGHRYVCFYPMDRRRGEQQNFYTVPIETRGRMMREHGETGRRFADDVRQIITGSMGFDDFEWGVTLWSETPLAFKKLIYEMRFDEASAKYAEFGPFYIGVRCPAAAIGDLLAGRLP